MPFCLQSCIKPLKYAIAVNDHGTEYVHSFIGKEPSGLRFNKLFLNEEGEPSFLWVSHTHMRTHTSSSNSRYGFISYRVTVTVGLPVIEPRPRWSSLLICSI